MSVNLIERAKGKETSLGVFINIADPKMVELAKLANFDFIRIDLEHYLMDYSTVGDLIRTANMLQLPVLVRVPNITDISKILDFGADGIIYPGVRSKEEALEVVRQAKYYPVGERGAGGGTRCCQYGRIPASEYMKYANDRVSVTLQIENKDGLDNIDDILSVKGVDMIASGKYDLSQVFGVPGEFRHPKVIEAENMIIRKALERGKYPTILAPTPERAKELSEMGVYICTIGTDCSFILKYFTDLIESYH